MPTIPASTSQYHSMVTVSSGRHTSMPNFASQANPMPMAVPTRLMISASADQEVVEKSLSRGAVDYLLKPFEAEELKRKVFQALKREDV